MTPSDSGVSERRGDSRLTFSIMFFAVALLCVLLGWAQGVRRDTAYLHIPENGAWLLAAAILTVIGVVLLLWSRVGRR